MSESYRNLRRAVVAETASIAVLLLNLATVHAEGLSSVLGPVHGTAYLAVIALAFTCAGSARSATGWLAVVPVVGGVLALRSAAVRS